MIVTGEKLIAFAFLLLLVISMAFCIFTLDKDGVVITLVAASCNEFQGSHNPDYCVSAASGIPREQNNCYYGCFTDNDQSEMPN